MSGQYRTDAQIAGPSECTRYETQTGAKCATLHHNVPSWYVASAAAQKRQVERDISAASEQAKKTAIDYQRVNPKLSIDTQAALVLALANTTDAENRRWILATLDRGMA